MQLNAFWRALARRWYLTLLGVLCAVAATVLVVGKVGPSYTVEGTVLLFPPSTTVKRGSDTVTEGNPYLFLGGLTQARDILIRSLTSQSARYEVTGQEPDANYEAVPDPFTSGPVVAVNVSGSTAASAVNTLNLVLSRVPADLRQMQSGLGLDDSAYITAKVLTVDKKPEVVRKQQIRAGIVAGAGMLGLSLLLVGLLDGLLGNRRSRRGAEDDPVATAPPTAHYETAVSTASQGRPSQPSTSGPHEGKSGLGDRQDRPAVARR